MTSKTTKNSSTSDFKAARLRDFKLQRFLDWKDWKSSSDDFYDFKDCKIFYDF